MIGEVGERAALQPRSVTALCAAVIAGAMDVVYIWIIVAQSDTSDIARVVFVAVAIAALAASAALGGTRPEASARLPFLGVSTGGLLALGYLGLFSIGLPLLAAGILSAVAWAATSRAAGPDHRRERWLAAGLAIAAPCVLVGSMFLT